MFQCFANQNVHVYINSKLMVVFFRKVMQIPTHKGEHTCECSIVPHTKRWNRFLVMSWIKKKKFNNVHKID